LADKWSEVEMVTFLTTGTDPDGKKTKTPMPARFGNGALNRLELSEGFGIGVATLTPGDGGERRGPVFTVSWDELISERERCQGMRAVLLLTRRILGSILRPWPPE
jgi:hypothetical protein